MIDVHDIPAVRILVGQVGNGTRTDTSDGISTAHVASPIVDVKALPAVQALIQQPAELPPKFARAPVGNGHEAALKDKR